jgi:endonuclease/exonuclease/phosphatase family metal-dependent hydrolase
LTKKNTFLLIQASSVLLFTFQALRVIFSVLFGIIYDGIFEGPFTAWLIISNLLVIASFLIPLLIGRKISGGQLTLWATIAGLARIALTVNIAIVRYWGSLLVILAGLIYLLGLLRRYRNFVFTSIVMSLSLDQLFKVLGTSFDITLRSWWLPIQILWALVLVWIGLQVRDGGSEKSEDLDGFGIGAGTALGGFFFLQSSLLSLPNGLARWSEISYGVIAPFLLAITVIFLVSDFQSLITRWVNNIPIRVVSLVSLSGGLMLGYFMKGIVSLLGLLVAQVASLIILLMINKTRDEQDDRTGVALSLGMIFFLVLNFLNAFAFTYPYTLPVMEGMGWLVYLVAGASLAFLILEGKRRVRGSPIAVQGLGLIPLIFGVLIAILSVWPVPQADLTGRSRLRFATYNIHYGYDDEWRYTLEDIAKTIEENNCDFIALQEVDTGRLTSYGVDNALYLARRLKMNVLYLPTVEHLTGIALLYRGSPTAEKTSLISSLQEQTGITQVSINDSGREIHVFGIWLGLSEEDTNAQISEALEFIGEASPAAFGGDFNADPESEVAVAIRRAGFSDPFETLAIDPAPNTSPAIDPNNRIDFVWLRGVEPVDAWVSDSLASDHRMVVVEVELPE